MPTLGKELDTLTVFLVRNSHQSFGLRFVSPDPSIPVDLTGSSIVLEIDSPTPLTLTATIINDIAMWTITMAQANFIFTIANGRITQVTGTEKVVLLDCRVEVSS